MSNTGSSCCAQWSQSIICFYKGFTVLLSVFNITRSVSPQPSWTLLMQGGLDFAMEGCLVTHQTKLAGNPASTQVATKCRM